LTGEIAFRGKARIDGTIEGNIDGEHLVLSETGVIKGDIVAETCNCFGRVEGNIKAEMLTARKNCRISGKIEAQSLTVEPGATITGEINAAAMKKPSTTSQLDSSAAAS
jgi:cytoskeletal protein CcmA (bactofilin family)